MVPRLYLTTVVENFDPDKLNRVRVAKEGEQDGVTDWVSVMTHYGSGDVGASFLPEIGDQVLVASLDTGDGQKVIVGSVWSNNTPPPETNENPDADLNKDGKNSLRFLKSRAGNQLIFDDTEGDEKVQLLSADGSSRFEFLEADELVSLTTEHDLTASSKKELSIQAEKVDIISEEEVNIDTEDCQIKAGNTAEMIADSGLDIKGSGVALN